jgi:transcription initiation factor IIE alpha subunit
VWYTANTRSEQRCDSCGGKLKEVDLIASKDIDASGTSSIEKKDECKVIYLTYN